MFCSSGDCPSGEQIGPCDFSICIQTPRPRGVFLLAGYNAPMHYVPGQRWISNAEPELGLGTVLRVEGRTVQLAFPATGVVRQYSMQTAPLTRSEFRPGERVSANGDSFLIEKIESHNGLLQYFGNGKTIAEGELDDVQNVSKADARLIAGRVDSAEHFEFRLETLTRRADSRRSNAFGLMSSRIDLIPHQLRVAEIAASRRPPRVLLADEVGLGKTIEAGMILARLLATGRASRVMILLPEALVYQWYVELLRRFNLPFAIFDEERCESIETAGDGRNPFDDEQLVICDIPFLRDSAKRREQALATQLGFAHRRRGASSGMVAGRGERRIRARRTVRRENAGRDPAHRHAGAARPHRPFRALAIARSGRATTVSTGSSRNPMATRNFPASSKNCSTTSRSTPMIAANSPRASATTHNFATPSTHPATATRSSMRSSTATAPAASCSATAARASADFPSACRCCRNPMVRRSPTNSASVCSPNSFRTSRRQARRCSSTTPTIARLPWLIDLLESHPDDKFFLTCRTKEKVLALEEALRTRSGVKIARFHEAMTLVQRDRNAAFFAERDGARLLLCAEIGSEGRNFQFAHNVILWDLPLDPDLLEQRIGRLDRIGQKHDIAVRAAAFTGTAQHMLMQWYRDGLDAFRSSRRRTAASCTNDSARACSNWPSNTRRVARNRIAKSIRSSPKRARRTKNFPTLIAQGRDRLLELANRRNEQADSLRAALDRGRQ